MRSSCWKEWDSKVVFSDKPSSSDSGKKLLKGANTSCSFCTEAERGEEMKDAYAPRKQKKSVTYSVIILQQLIFSYLFCFFFFTTHMQDFNKTHKKFKKPLCRSGISKNRRFGDQTATRILYHTSYKDQACSW